MQKVEPRQTLPARDHGGLKLEFVARYLPWRRA
jgi:hypothetical protein